MLFFSALQISGSVITASNSQKSMCMGMLFFSTCRSIIAFFYKIDRINISLVIYIFNKMEFLATAKNPQGKRQRSSIPRFRQRVKKIKQPEHFVRVFYFPLWRKRGDGILATAKNPQGKRQRGSIPRFRQRVKKIKQPEHFVRFFYFPYGGSAGMEFLATAKNPQGKRQRSSIPRFRQRVK